jgi:hypothetical protein
MADEQPPGTPGTKEYEAGADEDDPVVPTEGEVPAED